MGCRSSCCVAGGVRPLGFLATEPRDHRSGWHLMEIVPGCSAAVLAGMCERCAGLLGPSETHL